MTMYKVVTGSPTSIGSAVVTSGAHTIGIDRTSTNHVKLLIDGVEEDDYDGSADGDITGMTGVSAGFTASTGYCRFEDFAVYSASA